MEPKSIDSLIVQDMQNQQAPTQAAPPPVQMQPPPAVPNSDLQATSAPEATEQPASEVPRGTTESIENGSESVEPSDNQETPPEQQANAPIDEYGNPVEKPRMYSEEEVQRMMRERLSRRNASDPSPQQQQPQKANEQPQGDDWEVQLEGFIDKTVDKRERKRAETAWREQQAARHAEFEAKFTSGMSKYADFNSVVAGKPLTPGIMQATMGLENPAAFVYGASKLHPKELERIASINDPTAQALEVGRLHERMVKDRRATSAAPRPIEAPRSDIAPRPTSQRPNIDQLIHVHAQQKFNQRAGRR